MYKFLENRSDITFIGDPFASDYTEVCQELVEDQIITPERCVASHDIQEGFSGRATPNKTTHLKMFKKTNISKCNIENTMFNISL